jgi:hypothetical protein
MRSPLIVAASLLVIPATARAQSWKEVGKTPSKTVVSVDTKSVKRGGDTVMAVMRARFAEPNGDGVTSMKTTLTFNCATEKYLVRENISYAGTRVAKKSVPAKPGYGVVFGGSAAAVAYAYLCPKKP